MRARQVGPYSAPFCHAAEAWFWATSALAARHVGCRSSSGSGVMRPCEPDDVVKCLDQLYQAKRVNLAHARVLLKWGRQQFRPSVKHPAEAGEARLWDEAMARLEWVMRAKGIVA